MLVAGNEAREVNMDYKNIQSVLEYIHRHANERLDHDALAAKFFVSKFHFHRLFTENVGIPLARYIRTQKLRQGLALLLSTEMSILEISLSLNFRSHEGFTRAFRQLFNENPGTLRRTYKTRRWLGLYFQQRRDGHFMYDFAAPFTTSDKREAMTTVELICKLADLTQKEGVLALQNYEGEEEMPLFLKKGIALICDGWHPEIVKSLLENYIKFSSHQGAELLKRLLIVEGVLSIQSGEMAAIILEKQLSYLGEEFYEEARQRLGDMQTMGKENMRKYVNDYFSNANTENPAATHVLEDIFLLMNDYSIQCVLREVDTRDFELAFCGMTKALQQKFCNNLSAGLAMQFIKFFQTASLPSADVIIKAQNTLLSRYYKLKADGDIK